jgi:hypothetical protein
LMIHESQKSLSMMFCQDKLIFYFITLLPNDRLLSYRHCT